MGDNPVTFWVTPRTFLQHLKDKKRIEKTIKKDNLIQ